MRQFKFRIWDTTKKLYLRNKEMWRIRTDTNGEGTISPTCIYFKQHIKGYIIQQFTGLKDIRGNDIYEGDILECKWNDFHFYYKVYWLDRTASFELVFVKEYDYPNGFDEPILSWLNLPRLEIAGNEFQNPELLK